MDKPLIYYVNGTVVAKDGEHVFKGTRCLCGATVQELQKISNVIELVPNTDGLYYLQKEGRDDYGENYLIASHGITAFGCKGEGGFIGTILSPIGSYNRYKENIQIIKDLLKLKLDFGLERNLMRLLYVGVSGELEVGRIPL